MIESIVGKRENGCTSGLKKYQIVLYLTNIKVKVEKTRAITKGDEYPKSPLPRICSFGPAVAEI